MKGKTWTSITFLAMAALVSAAFVAEAGQPGVVTMPHVVRVGTTGTGNVTDGTAGYTAGNGAGFNHIDANISGAGQFTFTADNAPSAAVNDSGVTVIYLPPAGNVGEEELTATATCTVVDVEINIVVTPHIHRPTGRFYAAIYIWGYGRPVIPGERIKVNIKAGEEQSDWRPSQRNYSFHPTEFDRWTAFILRAGGVQPAATKFISTANYSIDQDQEYYILGSIE